MDLGAHLPLADLGDGTPTIDGLRDYVRTARDFGYAAVSANDHLVWRRPWLDGPTALAAVAGEAGPMTLATREAGAMLLLVWPLHDARAQLELLADATQ